MNFDRREVCLCCGTASVQQSRLKHYIASNGHNHKAGEQENTWVVCNNRACRRWQSLTCALAYCDRLINCVPHAAYDSNKWVQRMLSFYNKTEDVPPSQQIHVDHCMSCTLSSIIPPYTQISFQKLPIPMPLSTCNNNGGCVADGFASNTLTEHCLHSRTDFDYNSESDSHWEDSSE